jgi:hypothetical protein
MDPEKQFILGEKLALEWVMEHLEALNENPSNEGIKHLYRIIERRLEKVYEL